MRRFIYFVKGLTGSPSLEAFVRASKLGYAFPRGESFSTVEVHDGALGAGVLAACGDGVGLSMKDHTFHEVSERVFVGVPNDKMLIPGPHDLARQSQSLDGYPVVLSDFETWRIPVIRFLDGNTQLPRVLAKRNGHPMWIVKEEFEPLFNAAERIVGHLLEGNTTEYDPAHMLWFCAAALSVNYKIGETEVGVLGLIGSDNIRSIANAALDGPRLEIMLDEFKKKLNAPVPIGVDSPAGENG